MPSTIGTRRDDVTVRGRSGGLFPMRSEIFVDISGPVVLQASSYPSSIQELLPRANLVLPDILRCLLRI